MNEEEINQHKKTAQRVTILLGEWLLKWEDETKVPM